MVLPIIILVAIPIFFGVVYVSPFDQQELLDDEKIFEEPEFDDQVSEEPNVNILYFILIGIWTIILLRMLRQIKKGTFKTTRKF